MKEKESKWQILGYILFYTETAVQMRNPSPGVEIPKYVSVDSNETSARAMTETIWDEQQSAGEERL